MKKYIFIIFTILTIVACDDPISNITVVNKTGYDIYCYPSNLYPDTSLTKISVSQLTSLNTYSILTHETKEIQAIAYCDQEIWDTYVKNDTLLVFVFEKNIVDSKPFDSIIKFNLVHSKYLYTFEELQKKMCVITVE